MGRRPVGGAPTGSAETVRMSQMDEDRTAGGGDIAAEQPTREVPRADRIRKVGRGRRRRLPVAADVEQVGIDRIGGQRQVRSGLAARMDADGDAGLDRRRDARLLQVVPLSMLWNTPPNVPPLASATSTAPAPVAMRTLL